MNATSIYSVDFRPTPPRLTEPLVARVPRVTRLLAMAHRIERMIRAGQVRDLAEAARVCAVTRPRITQIMNLTLLCPQIQEEILELQVGTGRDPISERTLRRIVAEPDWTRQGELMDGPGAVTSQLSDNIQLITIDRTARLA